MGTNQSKGHGYGNKMSCDEMTCIYLQINYIAMAETEGTESQIEDHGPQLEQ